MTDAAGNTWTHEYDQRGREVEADDRGTGVTTRAFDDLGQVTSTTDARGRTLAYSYDPLGRKTSEHDGTISGSVLAEWSYDSVAKGYLAASTRFVEGNAYTRRVDDYDALYHAIGATVTIPAGEGGLAGAYQYDTSYNLDGTMQGTGYPSAGGLPAEEVSYGYDPLKRLTAVGGSLSSYVTVNRYTSIGQLEQVELSAGGSVVDQTFSYEPGTRRLAETRVDTVGVPGADRDAHYSYDDAGNITAISDVSRVGTDTQCFGYDYLARLVQAWTQNTQACADAPSADVVGGPAPYWQTYSYDATGNRTQEVDHGLDGAADTTRSYAYPAPGPHPHALTSVTQAGGAGDRTDTFTYDEAGNTTSRTLGTTSQQLTWDAEGHLESVTQDGATTGFVYDADGNRLLRRDPAGTTLYLPGQELHLDQATGQVSGTRYYTDGPDGPVIAARTPDGLQWLAADAQGTALLAINAATLEETRRWFTPFGQPRGQVPPDWPGGEHGFVNGIQDPSTGLTHLGAREYDPGIGRFISADPVIDTSDPQQMNGYAYGLNSPVTYSDPTGTMAWNGGGAGYGQQPKPHKPKAHSAATHHQTPRPARNYPDYLNVGRQHHWNTHHNTNWSPPPQPPQDITPGGEPIQGTGHTAATRPPHCLDLQSPPLPRADDRLPRVPHRRRPWDHRTRPRQRRSCGQGLRICHRKVAHRR